MFRVKEACEVAFYMSNGMPDAGSLTLKEKGKGLWTVLLTDEIVGKNIVIVRK